MAERNIEINYKNAELNYDVLYPKTKSDLLVMSGGEDLDEYFQYGRQYQVGDILTTMRSIDSFNNEWMVCDGSEVPSGYNINSLLNEDDTFNKAPNKQTTSLGYTDINKNIKEQNGVVGIIMGTVFYYTIDMVTWHRVVLTNYFSRFYGFHFYYDLNLEKYIIIGGTGGSSSNFGNLSLFSVEGFENNNITIQKVKEIPIGLNTDNSCFSDGRKIFMVSPGYNNEYFSVWMIDSETGEDVYETIENDEAGIRRIQDCFIINNKRYLIINNFSTNSPTTYSWVIVIGENSFIKNISIPYPTNRNRTIISSLINNEIYIKTVEKYYKINTNDNLIEVSTNFPASGIGCFLENNSKIYLFNRERIYVGNNILEYNKQYEILDETISTIYSSIKVFLNNFYYLGFCATNMQTYITLYYYKMSCFLPDSPNNPTGLTTMIKVN